MIPKPNLGRLGGTSDARLIALVREGDEHAFELIVRRHRRSLVAYCRGLGLADSRAEDAVQQAFLSAWLALRRGDEVRDLRAWLGRIAHNKTISIMRAGAEGRVQELDSALSELRGGAGPDLGGGLAFRETLADVAALPEKQREALLLSAVDGRSYEEVADALGVSPGAVRGLLHRARVTLREKAAALAPVPLARWGSGWIRRGGPSAGRVVEATATAGSSGGTGALLRGAATAFTALALVAGVAVGPLHRLISSRQSPRGEAVERGAGAPHGVAAALAAPASTGGSGSGSRRGAPSATPALRTASTAPAVSDAQLLQITTSPGTKRPSRGSSPGSQTESGAQQEHQSTIPAAQASTVPAGSTPAPTQTGVTTEAPPPKTEAPAAEQPPREESKDDTPEHEGSSDDGTEKPGESDDGHEHESPPPEGGAPTEPPPTEPKHDE